MIIILSLLFATTAFAFGFLLGLLRSPVKKRSKSRGFNDDLAELKKEYENFLNYDGTEQN